MIVVDANECIREELIDFNISALNSTQAYHSFLTLSQMGDFENAEICRMCASAMLEAAMDAFTRACRIKFIAEGQEGDEF